MWDRPGGRPDQKAQHSLVPGARRSCAIPAATLASFSATSTCALLDSAARAATKCCARSSSLPSRLTPSLKTPSRRSTYLGIHDYFLRQQQLASNGSRARTAWGNYQSSYTARCFSTTPARRSAAVQAVATPPERELTASELEWLAEEQKLAQSPWLQASQDPTSPSPSPPISPEEQKPAKRFDWRQRAISRLPVQPQSTPPSNDGTLFNWSNTVKRVHPSLASLEPGEPFYEEVREYEARFLPMLEAEQREEQEVVRERLATWPLSKLSEEGYCLQGMSAYWLEADLFGRPVANFSMGPGMTLPEHKFESGVQVLISRVDPLKETPHTASVVGFTKSHLKLSFLQRFELEDGQWRLDLGRSNLIYERTKAAISQLRQDPKKIEEMDAGRGKEYISQGTHLRDVLLQSFKPARSEDDPDPATISANTRELHAPGPEYPVAVLSHESRLGHDNRGIFKEDMRIQSWADRYSRPNPVAAEGDPVLEGLNDTQRRAVATMIGQRISLVQGPPGTGKTRTIIETVKLLKAHFEVPQPLMICTYTNVAVDNLVEGLVKAGLKPLRVGFGGKVQAELVEHTMDYKLNQHPARPAIDAAQEERQRIYKELDELRCSMAEDKARMESGAAKNLKTRIQRKQAAIFAKQRVLQALTSKIFRMEQQVLREILDAADVVCTTCMSAASAVLNVADFPVVFIDEASMSTEPASLVPLMKGSQHVALIGDHKQLPPVITSPEAQALGLGVSLFERLTEEGVVPSIMLDIQYRMHPKISRFPSSEFYGFGLRDGTVDAAGVVSSRLRPPRTSAHLRIRTGIDSGAPVLGPQSTTGLTSLDGEHDAPPVIFLNHTSYESSRSRSRVNHVEAQIVASVVEDLLLHNPDLQGADIGVIAPYVAQISLLDRLLKKNNDWKQRFTAVLGSHRALQLSNIEIKTVDGFEGREKDVIIFSTVRNNSSGYIGFLADERRLNVGLTRAKRGLFVVGGIETLKAGKRKEEPELQPVSTSQVLATTSVPSADAAKLESSPDKPKRAKKAPRTNRGVEAWRRYAKWLMDEGLIITLTGDALSQALYGNVRRARKTLQAIAADNARRG